MKYIDIGSSHAQINAKKGFSLLEILVALGIVTLIASAIMSAFGQYRSEQSKEGAVETILAALSQAHLDTIASKSDTVYGVNLKQNEVIYFKGAVYPGDNDSGNTHYKLPSMIQIANVSLNGGTTTVFFKRLTGATDNYGTFGVQVISRPTEAITVTINQTGATSL
jgi:prepilin-type N-terminal cleavage/methylation domain-containing protein